MSNNPIFLDVETNEAMRLTPGLTGISFNNNPNVCTVLVNEYTQPARFQYDKVCNAQAQHYGDIDRASQQLDAHAHAQQRVHHMVDEHKRNTDYHAELQQRMAHHCEEQARYHEGLTQRFEQFGRERHHFFQSQGHGGH